MNHLFIINPVAGKGKGIKIIGLLEEIFKNKENESYEFKITEYHGHGKEIAEEYLKDNVSKIYSIGGDGTANEILNGIMNSKLENLKGFGIIPFGSGNDFIKTISEKRYKNNKEDIKKFIEKIIDSEEKYIDIGIINESYFLNIASMGFDADVVFNGKKIKFLPPSMIYFFGVIYTIANLNSYSLEVQVNDQEKFMDKYLLIAAGNGKYYGGGMKVLPYSDCEDGLLDICFIHPVKRSKILRLLYRFMKGRHECIKEVNLSKCKSISIKSNEEISIQVDGEIMKGRELNLRVSDLKIPIIIPG